MEPQKKEIIVVATQDVERTDVAEHQEAARGAENAHVMTLGSALRSHRKAIFWSAFLSLALFMEGYQLVIVNSFFGQPQFQEKYGDVVGPEGTRQISAAWQTGLSNAALVGEIIGLAINSYVIDRFGYKKVYLADMVFIALAIFPVFFAPNLGVLTFGMVLIGIPWGSLQTLSTSYAAEVCPIPLRAYLASFVNMCWGMGIFLSSGIVRATLPIQSEWAYRLPFAIQWAFPIPLFLIALFAPESPWWLQRNGRDEEAARALRQLSDPCHWDEDKLQADLTLLRYTNALESTQANVSIKEPFQSHNRVRTETACVVWATQWLCGNTLIGFAVLFLQRAGLSSSASFDFNLSMNSMYIVGTIISVSPSDYPPLSSD